MSSGPSYDERLAVPWWWALPALALSLLAAAEIHGGAAGARAVVPYVVLPVLCLLALAVLSRDRVHLEDGVLHVRGARIPVRHLGAVTPLDRAGVHRQLGPLSQPSAFVCRRPWLTTAVRLDLTDPEDDTPYWLVGTRRPRELARALVAAGAAGPLAQRSGSWPQSINE